jgi:hypothetical protein
MSSLPKRKVQPIMLARITDFVASHPKPAAIALLGLLAIVVWATVWITLRCFLTYRKLTNTERLKIIEGGQSVELLRTIETQARRNRFFSIALTLAFWVPGIALAGATYATVKCDGNFSISIVVWSASIIVTITSVICATIVMGRQRAYEKVE